MERRIYRLAKYVFSYIPSNVANKTALRHEIEDRMRLEKEPLTDEWLEQHGFEYDYDFNECVAEGHYTTCKGYIRRGIHNGEEYIITCCNGDFGIYKSSDLDSVSKHDATLSDLYDALCLVLDEDAAYDIFKDK